MMHSATDPSCIAQRLMQQTHTRDGLPEIAVGVTFLAMAGLNYALAILPHRSTAFVLAVVALALFMPAWIFAMPWALRQVRRRYLIEREGYVEPAPAGRKPIAIGITVAVVVAVAIAIMTRGVAQPDRWLLAGTGVFGGVLAFVSGRLLRFGIIGALMSATGLCLAGFDVPLTLGFAILFGVAGLLSLISGSVVFARFLRQPIETGA